MDLTPDQIRNYKKKAEQFRAELNAHLHGDVPGHGCASTAEIVPSIMSNLEGTLTDEQRAENERRARAEAAQQIRASIKARRERLWAKAGVPQRVRETVVREDGPFEKWAAGLATIRALSKGYLTALVGGRGNGKSQIGGLLVRDRIWRDETARYLCATHFFLELRACYKVETQTEEAMLQKLRAVSLVVMDEAGKRGETDWENQMLFRLLDDRYGDLTDTLLISNQSAGEFLRSIGTSLASRLKEVGSIIECDWPSFR